MCLAADLELVRNLIMSTVLPIKYAVLWHLARERAQPWAKWALGEWSFFDHGCFSGFIFGYIHTCRNESIPSTAGVGEEDTVIFAVSSSFTLVNEGRETIASADTGGIQLYKAYSGLKRSGVVDKIQESYPCFLFLPPSGCQRGSG